MTNEFYIQLALNKAWEFQGLTYPNPAENIVNIQIVGIEQTEVIIKICDLSGKVLKSVSTNIMGDHTFNISIENFPDGIYICKIESNNEVYTMKLNVMR